MISAQQATMHCFPPLQLAVTVRIYYSGCTICDKQCNASSNILCNEAEMRNLFTSLLSADFKAVIHVDKLLHFPHTYTISQKKKSEIYAFSTINMFWDILAYISECQYFNVIHNFKQSVSVCFAFADCLFRIQLDVCVYN